MTSPDVSRWHAVEQVRDGIESRGASGYQVDKRNEALDALARLAALADAAQDTEKRIRAELHSLEKWAGEQNADNAYAEQVRYWALSHLERLDRSGFRAALDACQETAA